jgi:para-nitrobenzyl esterase
MPAAQGLFHKASIESGAQLRRVPKDVATETARRVLKGLGVGVHELHKLAEVAADTFVRMQLQAEHQEGPLLTPSGEAGNAISPALGPVVDGHILPTHPFDPAAPPTARDVPLMIGFNHDEATFFNREHPEFFHLDDATLVTLARKALGENADRALAVYRRAYPQATPSELFIAASTAISMGNDAIMLAELKAAQPAPVYFYRYDYRSNVPIAGTDWTLRAGHATEIAPKFDNYDIVTLQGNGPGVREVSRNMSALWTSFARHGRPGANDLPSWPRYDLKRRATMLIDVRCQVVDDPDRPIRELWQSLRRSGA